MAITIHKGIPAPAPTQAKYPFDDLSVGDMFHVPITDDENGDIQALSKRVASATSMRRKRSHGTEEYVVQQVRDDNDVLGVGVWRVG